MSPRHSPGVLGAVAAPRARWQRARLALGLGLALALFGCGDDGGAGAPTAVRPAPDGKPWATLAEWGLFADAATQTPNARVVPYGVVSPLFTDYALKHRFIWVPEGEAIGYAPVGPLDLPRGSIVVKTFALPVDARDPSLGEQLIETRLYVHESGGWVGHTYVYAPGDPDPAHATRTVAGAIRAVSWIDATGATRTNDYAVPNTNECTDCHGTAPATRLVGVVARQLNHDALYDGVSTNQLDELAAVLGFTSPLPAVGERPTMPDPFGDAPLAERARSYLDANCAHCHSAVGAVNQKALFFDWEHSDPSVATALDIGACKVPTSAGGATCGRTYDIVPGAPDASILICRVESDQAKVMMPPLGRRLVHDEGVALLREWIASMPADDCR